MLHGPMFHGLMLHGRMQCSKFLRNLGIRFPQNVLSLSEFFGRIHALLQIVRIVVSNCVISPEVISFEKN